MEKFKNNFLHEIIIKKFQTNSGNSLIKGDDKKKRVGKWGMREEKSKEKSRVLAYKDTNLIKKKKIKRKKFLFLKFLAYNKTPNNLSWELYIYPLM